MRRFLLPALATAVGSTAALTLVVGAAAAADDRPYVLSEGHVDMFEVTYDDDIDGLRLQVKDDTGLYDSTTQFRAPEDVTIGVAADAAATEVPEGLPPDYAFVGDPGDTIYLLPQVEAPGLPWPGWSTERLMSTLPPGVDLPDTGDAVQLSVDIDGPGDVHTYMSGAAGNVINHYLDTTDGGPDIIPMTRNTHAHTEWIFTELGNYTLTVTPTATTVRGDVLSAEASSYHLQVGPGGSAGEVPLATTTTVTLGGAPQSYGTSRPALAQVTVTTDDGPASGTVAVRIGAAQVGAARLDGNGRATVTMPHMLRPGSHAVRATFAPADPEAQGASQSVPVSLKVTKASTRTAATLAKKRIRAGARARMAVKVTGPGNPSGKVKILRNGKRVTTARLVKGKVSLRLPKLRAGKHKIVARFVGNALLNGSTSRKQVLTVVRR
jgi:surface-anchored protein